MDDITWPWRVGVGLSLLAVLAAVDLVRHPKNPTRIKEYGFILASALLAMAYGVLHDAATYALSPEYFTVGKGLESAKNGYFPSVAILALKASWSVGLVVGLVFVVVNNPSKRWAQLPYRRLVRFFALPAIASICVAGLFGLSARALSADLVPRLDLDRIGLGDPENFLTVWAIHNGTYLGALIGVIAGAIGILWTRRRSAFVPTEERIAGWCS